MTYLTAKEAAKALGETVRTVEIAVQNKSIDGHFVKGKGRGGKQLRIALESLPDYAQARYRGEQESQAADIRLSLTESQRELLDYKQMVVLSYQDFKTTYPKADKRAAFLQQYNEQHPDTPLTKRQLNHWETLYNRDGLAGLVDRRGGYNKGVSTIPEKVKQAFLAYWLQEKGNRRGGGPSIASCYRLTQFDFPDQQLPSISAFQRLVQTIPYPTKVLGREGKKAFADKCEPYIQFDYRSICTNEIWCADNHVFDLWTKDEEGRVFRPWLVSWMDKRSRYIVGYQLLDHDPNADSALVSFAKAVKGYGVPERVLLDNGADFTVHDIFNKQFALSLANEMAIAVTNATPYNAKAKLIERFFNTLEYTYCIHLPSYFGPDPQRRPEKMKKAPEELKKYAILFSDFSEWFDKVIGQYNNTVHTGDGMDGKTPKQAFEDFVVRPIKHVNPTLLSMYFKRTSRLLTVGRNGVRVPELQTYFDSEKLIPYQKKKIYVRYDTEDVRQVYCFTETDEFICMADSVSLGNLHKEVTAQNMRKLNARRKQMRKEAKKYSAGVTVPSLERMALAEGNYYDTPNLELLPGVEAFNPSQQKKAEKVKEAAQKQKAMRENGAKELTEREEEENYVAFMTGG